MGKGTKNSLDRMPHRRPTHRLSPAYKDKVRHRTNWAAPDDGWPRFCEDCGTRLPSEEGGLCDVCLGVSEK